MSEGWIAPANPTDYETRCAVIWYPDDGAGLYRAALRGALTALTHRFRWDATPENRLEISQIWLDHDQRTNEGWFGADCEIIEALTEDGEMAINVNVEQKCGCCGGGDTNITINDNDTPIVFDPEQELPEGVPPTLDPTDPATPEPPDPIRENGPQTWTEYDEEACRTANYMAQLPPRILRAFETAIDRYSAIGAAYSILAGVLPAGWLTQWGSLPWTTVIDTLTEILVVEGASDSLKEVAEDYENEIMEDMVCALYNARYTLGGSGAAAVSDVVQWLNTTTFGDVVKQSMARFFGAIWGERILTDLLINAVGTPPADLVDCSTCETGNSWLVNFGTLDGGAFPEFEPDASGRATELNRAINIAPNATFPVVKVVTRAGQVQAAINGGFVTEIRLNASSWNDPATPSATCQLEVDLLDAQGQILENVQFVTLAEYPAFQKNGNTADLDDTRTLVSKPFSGNWSPEDIHIIAVNAAGGAAQFQIGYIEVIYS